MSARGSNVEEEEEEEEPILKYSRLEGGLSQILEKDSVSAFAICSTAIVIGSHNGVVYILDLQGREIKRYRAHTAAIAAVSVDTEGTTIASAGIDGRAVVFNIVKPETVMYDFKRPLRAVSIDPECTRNGRARLISGGLAGQLILSEKGWMGNKETVISANEGPILQIAWHGNLVAWSNDRGVRVYDLYNSKMVGLVERRPESPRADIFKCRLLWKDSRILIIGWFDHIFQVQIEEGVAQVLNLDTTYIMKLDCVVSGLAMLDDNLLIVAYNADLKELVSMSSKGSSAERPEIRLINPKFEEISEDALGVRDYTKLQPNDYAVYAHPREKRFFIISPKDIVTATERDVTDHVAWLVETERYDEALIVAKQNTSLPVQFSYFQIGCSYLEKLQDTGDYQKAASLAPQVFMEDVEAWEKLVFGFAEKGHLEDITPYVPVEHPVLSSVVYEMALGQYLNASHEMLLNTVRKWPVEIYNAQDIINAIEHRLMRTKDNQRLKECLAELLLKTDQPREALPYYLALGKTETFELIQAFHLFDTVQDSILDLVVLDTPAPSSDSSVLDLANPKAIQLLVQHSHSISSSKVVDQLQHRPALLYCYFRALLEHDPQLASNYSDLQIDLYAEYDRTKLMLLLESTTTYSLEKAAKICEQRDYIPELVYIYGKTGNNKKALRLIIEKLGDVQQAIGYATSQADPELWEDLISYSLDKPPFIRGLLEHPGTAIKPVDLIRRLRPGLVIEGLKDTLSKIFNDLDLQMSLSQCGSNIHRREISNLSDRLRAGQRRGIALHPGDMAGKQANTYVFFDGTSVDETELVAISNAATSDSKVRRDEYNQSRRRTTALKVTTCAVNRSKLLAIRSSGQ